MPDTPRDELLRPSIGYLRSSANHTAWDTIAFLPGSEQVHVDVQGPLPVIPPFPPHGRGWVASLAVGTDGSGAAGGNSAEGAASPPGVRICLDDQSDWEIRCFGAGGEVRIRWSGTPVPVDPAEVAAWREERATALQRMLGPRIHALLDRVPIPAHRAPYDRLILDSSGHLWIRHPRSLLPTGDPDRFTVMDPAGVWLGEVSLPRLDVLEIGDDYLLGVSTDEMGVESLRVHPLRRE